MHIIQIPSAAPSFIEFEQPEVISQDVWLLQRLVLNSVVNSSNESQIFFRRRNWVWHEKVHLVEAAFYSYDPPPVGGSKMVNHFLQLSAAPSFIEFEQPEVISQDVWLLQRLVLNSVVNSSNESQIFFRRRNWVWHEKVHLVEAAFYSYDPPPLGGSKMVNHFLQYPHFILC